MLLRRRSWCVLHGGKLLLEHAREELWDLRRLLLLPAEAEGRAGGERRSPDRS